MFTEEERAKWRERVARWRNGEQVYDAGRIVEKSDNTSVQKQEPVAKIKRDFVAEATRKHAAEAVGPDTRSQYQRQQSQSAKQYANQQYQKAKDDAKRAEGMEQLMKTVSPSTYVEAATGQDLGAAGRLITDAAIFGVPGLIKRGISSIAKGVANYRYPLGRPRVPENFLTVKPQVRTKIGDVEIDNPGLYYHQSDAGKAKNFVSTGRMRTPLEESWLAKEEAGEKIPLVIRSGIKPGYPQDPGSAMFSQGSLWYGLTPNKPDLLVTAREMPIANKNASIMSNKASLRKLEEQGTRRVTNDNIYTQGPHNRQNTTAYTWEPGYGYRKVFAEETPAAISWKDAQKPLSAEQIFPNARGAGWLQQTADRLGINVNHYYNNLITPEELNTAVKNSGYETFVSGKTFTEPAYIPSGFPYGLDKAKILMPYEQIRKMPMMAKYANLPEAEFRKVADDLIGSHEFIHWYNKQLTKNIKSGRMKTPKGYQDYELTWNGENLPDGIDPDALGEMQSYMSAGNGTESNARLGQLFNAFNIKKGQFAPQHINLAKKFYRQVFPDNQMSLFLNAIKDKDALVKFANRNAGTLFSTGLGAAVVNKTTNTENEL